MTRSTEHRTLRGSQGPAQARELVSTVLSNVGAVGTGMRDSVRLVTSELVTNAVRHGQGDVNLDVSLSDHHLRVSASASSSTDPAPSRGSTTDEGGRGLSLIQRLSESWGWQRDGDRVTVWAEIDLHGEQEDETSGDDATGAPETE